MEQLPLILLVEDSPTQAQQLAAELESYALQVLVADDGPIALDMAYEQQPDVIVLDINLPSMSGYQVCEILKQRQGNLLEGSIAQGDKLLEKYYELVENFDWSEA